MGYITCCRFFYVFSKVCFAWLKAVGSMELDDVGKDN